MARNRANEREDHLHIFKYFISATLILIALVGVFIVGCSGKSDNPDESISSPTPSPAGADNSPVRLDLPLDKTEISVDNARLLMQASFGVTHASLALANRFDSPAAWIDDQMAKPITMHLPKVEAYGNASWSQPRHWVWWETAITAEDQLRQRTAFALSEIFVVSDIDYTLSNSQHAVVHYYDMLASSAFGNFRDLLEDVTLHPVMGIYLSMLRNEKADEENNVRPDENYAREIMQLFTIGLYELNEGGTPVPVGNPKPAYTQSTVEEYARVFTGWDYADSPDWRSNKQLDKISPLVPNENYHDSQSKQLINGETTPAGLNAQEDLELALDSLFNHPNVGPFIGKQLIQKLVTSNPSEAYVARVAAVFNDNGRGERGDLGAVIKAILLDSEARQTTASMNAEAALNFGKLKEPVIKAIHIMRALNAIPGTNSEGRFHLFRKTSDAADQIYGQSVQSSPSVFNFFSPTFQSTNNAAGGEQKPFYAPELQILTESLLSVASNDLHSMLYTTNNRSGRAHRSAMLDIDAPMGMLRKGRNAYLEHLDMLLMAGTMSDTMYSLLSDFINERIDVSLVSDEPESVRARYIDRELAGLDEAALEDIVLDSLFMILASPDFMVQQ